MLKGLIILAFNNESFNTILCNISIISNENKETFISILDHLKTKYRFMPKSITIDYSLAEYNPIKYDFSNKNLNISKDVLGGTLINGTYNYDLIIIATLKAEKTYMETLTRDDSTKKGYVEVDTGLMNDKAFAAFFSAFRAFDLPILLVCA